MFVDELPRNTMGKVQKNVLRERYRDITESPYKAGSLIHSYPLNH